MIRVKNTMLQAPRVFRRLDADGIDQGSYETHDPSAAGITEAPPAGEGLLPKQTYRYQKGTWTKVYDLRGGGAFSTVDGKAVSLQGIFEALPAGLTTQKPADGKTLWNPLRQQWEADLTGDLMSARETKKLSLRVESVQRLRCGLTVSLDKPRRFRALQGTVDRLGFLLLHTEDDHTFFENYDPESPIDRTTGESLSSEGDWYRDPLGKSSLEETYKRLKVFWADEKEKLFQACQSVESAKDKAAVESITLG